MQHTTTPPSANRVACRPCQTQPCAASLPTSFSLVLGPWSACNSTCSYGGRTRSANCVSKEGYIGSLDSCGTSPAGALGASRGDNSWGEKRAVGMCFEALRDHSQPINCSVNTPASAPAATPLPMPVCCIPSCPPTHTELSQQLWEPCILPACATFTWFYSDWICNNAAGCGGGTARRNATCKLSSAERAVDASMCDAALLDNSTQPCAQAPCVVFYWRPKELADCLPEEPSKPCGRVSG